ADGTDAEDGSDDAAGASEEAGDGAAEALSEDDLTAVGDTYYEFLEAAAASDGEAACSLITNPDTDEPLKSGEVKLCAEGFEGGAEESPVDPSLMDAIDRSMVEAGDNGDGTAGVTLMGQDAGVTFVDVEGSWCRDGRQSVRAASFPSVRGGPAPRHPHPDAGALRAHRVPEAHWAHGTSP